MFLIVRGFEGISLPQGVRDLMQCVRVWVRVCVVGVWVRVGVVGVWVRVCVVDVWVREREKENVFGAIS